jgi:FKBP-type peptidyl-prolyl cis-trans isomerase FkpA/FKBP-type peptidyl-prolyl cis-trans isomerase FklB
MRHFLTIIAATLIATASVARAAEPELKTDDDKTIYTLGILLSRNLAPFSLTEHELDLVKMGLTDGALNKPKKAEPETYGPKIQALQQARASAAAAGEKKAAEPFLAKAAAEKGAKKTATGLIYQEVSPGTGESPKPTDRVKVHYTGTLINGTVFDSSVKRGQPATFPLNGVVPCWTEGLQLMKVGGKAKLICPADLAYGDRGQPPLIKPGSTLVFDVELLEIVPPTPPAARPSAGPSAAPPAGAPSAGAPAAGAH